MTFERQIVVLYRNWKGEVADRRVEPCRIYFGSTAFHPETQWLLEVFDFGKREYRTFAVKDILSWNVT